MTTLCKSCRYHVSSIHSGRHFNYDKCTHDQGLVKQSFIRLSDGLNQPAEYQYCDVMRKDHGPCGPFALLFIEPEEMPHNIQQPF